MKRMKHKALLKYCASSTLFVALWLYSPNSHAQLTTTSEKGGDSATSAKAKGEQDSNLKGQQTPSIGDECPTEAKYEGGGADGSTRYCISVEQKSLKRCETSYFEYLKRDTNTHISFDFQLPKDAWDFHDVWTSIFQIHSKPDPGEQWRCPIAMLQVQGHTLSMWDRYDLSPISTTINGTCADAGNSIQGREVFRNEHMEPGRWYHLDLQAVLSLSETGSFTVRLDDKVVGSFSGPNTFNDQHQPFVKIGIYKPSPWRAAKRLCVDYRNFSIKAGEE